MNTDRHTLARPRRSRHLLLLCGLGALLLAACDRRDADSAAPPVKPARIEMGMTPASALGTSVPAADSVLSPAPGASQPGAAAARSNTGMTAAQESSAMPMAGQNNDHSAPVATGKRASSP
ncbi:MAG: hypothetical protein A3E25_15475 [Burkholderiales bacterium RIFCSPHIGHO2_12_FULL_69_20]|nr:MAG: hypothetical protein A3E25_15475 [Burkholderiales bacterium RIFCSPHIGHO2_12_FULL_69_20]